MSPLFPWSPNMTARAGGFFYLLMVPLGVVGKFAQGKILVPNDPAATAANILAHGSMLWVWVASDLLVVVSYVLVTALFLELFRQVSRGISMLASFFSLIGCGTQAFATVFKIAPLVPSSGAQYLKAFRPEQLQALSFLFFKLYTHAYTIGLVFFAFYGILIGYLILKSAFLPRLLGIFMMLAGLGWLTFLYPPLATELFSRVLLPLSGLGEGGLSLWLLVRGMNVPRWEEQAATAGDRYTSP